MARSNDSGPSDEYSDTDEAALEEALWAAWLAYLEDDPVFGPNDDPEDYPVTDGPTRLTVTAEVEWAGTKMARDGGVRTVRLDGLEMDRVLRALQHAHKDTAAVASAGATLRAKGWEAQLSRLVKDRRGRAATDHAGLTVTRDTLLKWLSGQRDPSPANQRKIAEAYGHIRQSIIDDARTKAERSRHLLANEVSASLERRYGSQIRLRRITSMTLIE